MLLILWVNPLRRSGPIIRKHIVTYYQPWGAASPDRIHEGELFGPVTVNGNDYIPKDVELYVGKVSRSPVGTGSNR